jgi:hypothetical protein
VADGIRLLGLLGAILLVAGVFWTTFRWYTAQRRAAALLCRHLSLEDRAELKRFGALTIPSRHWPERTYQIRAQTGRVLVRQAGVSTMELCIRSEQELPGDEHLLVHKLMIQAAEDEYLARANVVWQRAQASVSGRMSRFD